MSVLGCDLRVFHDLQVSGTKRCCVTARVYSFWEVRLGKHSDQDHLAESYWRLPYLLVWCAWITPEWQRRTLKSVYFFKLEMVIPLYWLPWLLFFVNCCRHSVGNQQTCCFRKLLQWCHSPCCVPFWRMVNKSCDCFCCSRWYRQGIVSYDSLGFCSCFNSGSFKLHR